MQTHTIPREARRGGGGRWDGDETVAQNVRGRRRVGREDANKEGGAFAISIAPAHQQQNVVNSSDGVVARRPAHMRLNLFEPQLFFPLYFSVPHLPNG